MIAFDVTLLLILLAAAWVAAVVSPASRRNSIAIAAGVVSSVCALLACLRFAVAPEEASPVVLGAFDRWMWIESLRLEWSVEALGASPLLLITTCGVFVIAHALRGMTRICRRRTTLLLAYQIVCVGICITASSFFLVAFFQLGLVLMAFAAISKSGATRRGDSTLRVVFAISSVGAALLRSFAMAAIWAAAERVGVSGFELDSLVKIYRSGDLEGATLFSWNFAQWTAALLLLAFAIPLLILPLPIALALGSSRRPAEPGLAVLFAGAYLPLVFFAFVRLALPFCAAALPAITDVVAVSTALLALVGASLACFSRQAFGACALVVVAQFGFIQFSMLQLEEDVWRVLAELLTVAALSGSVLLGFASRLDHASKRLLDRLGFVVGAVSTLGLPMMFGSGAKAHVIAGALGDARFTVWAYIHIAAAALCLLACSLAFSRGFAKRPRRERDPAAPAVGRSSIALPLLAAAAFAVIALAYDPELVDDVAREAFVEFVRALQEKGG